MTLQSTILKTKKRLSSDNWNLSLWLIAIMGLFAIASFAMRAVSISWKYGVVDGQLPIAVYSQTSKEPGLSLERNIKRQFEKEKTINDQTMTVVLTRNALYFGPVLSFTEGFSDVQNKFFINHLDGAPQIDVLRKTMDLWSRTEKRKLSKQVILIPTSEIPMPIVIQTMAGLKKDKMFDTVVLGSGLI